MNFISCFIPRPQAIPGPQHPRLGMQHGRGGHGPGAGGAVAAPRCESRGPLNSGKKRGVHRDLLGGLVDVNGFLWILVDF